MTMIQEKFIVYFVVVFKRFNLAEALIMKVIPEITMKKHLV